MDNNQTIYFKWQGRSSLTFSIFILFLKEYAKINLKSHNEFPFFKLQKPRYSKSFRQQTFPIRCIDDWNALPEYLVEIETVYKFKTELDKIWSGRRFDLDHVY